MESRPSSSVRSRPSALFVPWAVRTNLQRHHRCAGFAAPRAVLVHFRYFAPFFNEGHGRTEHQLLSRGMYRCTNVPKRALQCVVSFLAGAFLLSAPFLFPHTSFCGVSAPTPADNSVVLGECEAMTSVVARVMLRDLAVQGTEVGRVTHAGRPCSLVRCAAAVCRRETVARQPGISPVAKTGAAEWRPVAQCGSDEPLEIHRW